MPIREFEIAVDRARAAARHPAQHSAALVALATTLAAIGMGEQAVAMAGRAIAAADASGDDAMRAGAHSALGIVLRGLGAARAARRELRLAATLLRRCGDRQGLKRVATEIGHAYRVEAASLRAAGWPEQARPGWARALRTYRVALRRGNAPAADALLWCAIAECEYRLGRAFECRASANRALGQGPASHEVVAQARHWEAQALRASGELSGAVRAAALARAAAEQLDDPSTLAQCLMASSRLEDLQGRFEAATDFERRAREVGVQLRERQATARTHVAPLLERLDAPVAARVAVAA